MLLKQNVISLAAFITISICPSVACQAFAGHIYQFVNYPEFQDGGTLSGYIEIWDSYVPSENQSNNPFQGFEWTATLGDNTYSMTSSSLGGGGGVGASFGAITITENAILLTQAMPDLSAILKFERQTGSLADGTFSAVRLQYRISPIPGDSNYRITEFTDIMPTTSLWNASPPNDGLGGTSWVIAVRVPEPATVTLLVFGSLFMLTRRNRPN